MELKHIVAATDESDAGREAVRAGLAIALRTGARVTVMRAVQVSSAQVIAAVPEAAELTHSSNDGLLEISAVGVSKASGLATVCADLGVTADQVVAFGDMPNDLPMLAWAGLGVAVANAHPEVLAAADEVTARNDDDGVAQVLDRWF